MSERDMPWKHWCRDCGITPVKAPATSCTMCERAATALAREATKQPFLCEACGETEAALGGWYCDDCEDAMVASLGDRPEPDGEACVECGVISHEVVFGSCDDCYKAAKRAASAPRPKPAPYSVPPYHEERQTLAARRQKVTA